MRVAVVGRLGGRVGSLEALTCAALVGTIDALAVLLIARGGFGRVASGFTGPKLGHCSARVLGAVIVLSGTVAGPRIGSRRDDWRR